VSDTKSKKKTVIVEKRKSVKRFANNMKKAVGGPRGAAKPKTKGAKS